MPDAAGLAEAMHPELLKTFKPAFIGRTVLVPYFPLSPDVLKGITRLKLNKIKKRVVANYQAEFSYDDKLVDTIVERCKEVETGARNVDNILTRTVLPELSKEFLSKMAEGGVIKKVHITVNEDGTFKYEIGVEQ
jgi:type VI secretion system protein VasG